MAIAIVCGYNGKDIRVPPESGSRRATARQRLALTGPWKGQGGEFSRPGLLCYNSRDLGVRYEKDTEI